MNLPKVIADLVDTQNSQDGVAYTECFSESAVVYDEEKTYKGRAEILDWIERANQEYQTALKPLNWEDTGSGALLSAEVSGTFPGSPAILKYHLKLEDGLIQSLKITG